MPDNYNEEDFNEREQEALNIVEAEKSAFNDQVVFVTDKVAFDIPNLIRTNRKNYWGIFDQQYDPNTKRKKVWVPLTQTVVEATVAKTDVDQKDINFIGKSRSKVHIAHLVRSVMHNEFDRINLSAKIDKAIRDVHIDGTKVWKTYEGMDPVLKEKTLRVAEPDLLNCMIDPSAESIQEAYRFTERALLSEQELRGMTGWYNTDKPEVVTGLNPDDSRNPISYNSTSTKKIDVYEMWGKIPAWITDKNLEEGTDKGDEEIDGHIVVSGLDSGQKCVHLIEENKKGLKPYEEAWSTRVSNRWYGLGIPEKLLMLQLWMNIVVNVRINRASVSQLGIFKIKKNAGITPKMVSGLISNGAIKVNNMDDLQQMAIQDVPASSYNDETAIWTWAQRQTSAYEAAIGAQLPASTPATNAVLLNQNANASFTLLSEGFGNFLERWTRNHAMPIAFKSLRRSEIIRLSGNPEDLRALDEMVINAMLVDEVEKIEKEGGTIDPQQVELERQKAIASLATMGKDRYYSKLEKLNPADWDVKVYVTNESIDKNVIAKNLIFALQAAPEYKEGILEGLFDLMGLDQNMLRNKQVLPQGQPQGEAPQGPQLGQPSTDPLAQVTSALTDAQVG